MKRPGLALGVWGEPGIGKTHASLALLRGTPCQTKTVHSNQALEKILLQLPPKKLTLWLEKILERLLRGETLEPGILNQALVAVLAANAPIVLHVEDLHEANPERLEFWKQLAVAVTRTRGVGLIVTSRAQPPESFEAIRLSVLTREESDVLLEAEVSAKLPTEALAWLFERAAGNPLFTLEFFRLLARQGSLWNDGQRWRFRTPEHETMPVTVEALIEQVLHETASTPALENAIGAKAMLELEAPESLWADVAGLTLKDLNAVKQELEHRGVLLNAEFAHPLFREVIAHGLRPEQRRKFARRALEVLKDDPRAAAEFVKDANLEAGEALGWLERAATMTSEAGNQVKAAQFLARSTEFAVGEKRGILAYAAAKDLRQINLHEAANMAKIAFQIQPHDPERRIFLAELLACEGHMDEVDRLIENMPDQPDDMAWLAMLLKLRINLNDYTAAFNLLNKNPTLLETTNPDVAHYVARTLLEIGDTIQAKSVLEQSFGHIKTLDQHVNFLNVLALIAYYAGESQEAARMFTQILNLLEDSSQLRLKTVALFNRSLARGHLNDVPGSLDDLETVIRLCAELGDSKRYAHAQVFVGRLLTTLGEYERAEEKFLSSQAILEPLGPSSALLDCVRGLSSLYCNWYSPYAGILAMKYASIALQHARFLQSPSKVAMGLYQSAVAQIGFGDAARGLEFSLEMLGLAQSTKQPELIYYAYFAQALALDATNQPTQALAAFEQALNLTAEPLQQHSTGLEIDRLTNNLAGARVRLAWFEERGLMNGVNIALRYFPELATNPTSPSSITETSLQLEVLGSMQITLEAQTTPVRGRKRQELLALLLEARISGRSEVSKLELVDKLYSDADEIQANAGLRDVIYQIRSSLGENAITTTANGYALGTLKTDVETFLETGNTKLWRGIYLEGLTLETSDTVRESLYLALRTRAEALLETDPVEVTRVGRLLCEADPYDLEALCLTAMGLRSQQNHRSLSRFYDAARTRFLEIGEVLPVRWQDFLSSIGTTA
jgi:tetratricopeptide (TPR) repeat protein